MRVGGWEVKNRRRVREVEKVERGSLVPRPHLPNHRKSGRRA